MESSIWRDGNGQCDKVKLGFKAVSAELGQLSRLNPLVRFEPRTHRLRGWIVDFPSQVPRRLLNYPEPGGTVTSVPVLLFKMRCMFFFTVKTCLCAASLRVSEEALSEERKYSFLFFPFCLSFSMEAPCIPHALPCQTVFDFLPQRHNRLCHFISDIMDYFLAGEDQQQTNH